MKALIYTLLAAGLLASCKKESETVELESPAAYVSTTPGKYISYRLDSTVFTSFGANTVVRSYQEKHVVDRQITDALGRPAYRVFRYLRDTLGTKPWAPAGTYTISSTANTVEISENNLRILKLAIPVQEGYVWNGNRYLPDDAYAPAYEFSNDNGIGDWDFTYTETGGSAMLGGKTFQNVVTVTQVDEATNAPVTDFGEFGIRNYSVERYAKGLGLVFQELIMWEYQAPSSPRPGYRGFGVKRSIIDHN